MKHNTLISKEKPVANGGVVMTTVVGRLIVVSLRLVEGTTVDDTTVVFSAR
jgi:hypothetical protein